MHSTNEPFQNNRTIAQSRLGEHGPLEIVCSQVCFPARGCLHSQLQFVSLLSLPSFLMCTLKAILDNF